MPRKTKIAPKLIYIVDSDDKFARNLSSTLGEADYIPRRMKDIFALKKAVAETKPLAMIIDIENLGAENTQALLDLQKQHAGAIPLFCTAKTSELAIRLHALRIGSMAFFPKPIDIFYLIKTLDQVCGLNDLYRILIIGDSHQAALEYKKPLKEAGMITHEILDLSQLIVVLDEFQPDLIIMDVNVAECSGTEIAAVLRQEAAYNLIPIIFIIPAEDKVKQLSALSLCGDDFLIKPVDPFHLVTTVKLRVKREAVLKSFMTTDNLTGLMNHLNFIQRLEIEVARAQRQKIPLCLLMIDIDNFKEVNEDYGHISGNRVLKKLAEFLVTQLRKIDIVARYGGEEFAVILTDSNLAGSIKVGERLCEQFSQITFNEDDSKFSVTFSCGIAAFPDIKTARDLLDAAEKALQKAKNNGRNQVGVE